MLSSSGFISPEEAKKLNPVTLAFVGDAVFSLYVREELVLAADYRAGDLQKLSSERVSAHGQSGLAERVCLLFNEEEADIFRRGRNAKKPSRAKHASVGEYNRSTGLEAVLGYLYLTGQLGRIDFLLKGTDEN
ncbi:MAG TPA: ribonuclease III [Candidatus Coproplasma excrementigallinarum]|uniref:Mini-ribonuclease 3 n=1 Tax=Candidatus Coproplasma excrementigallinarum TaxID=2840747 RepID=A0A9D1SIV3_9FIRM|nr:ribonuclease III [Candidatus Coproplasma excrementigallinarum]